MGFSLGAIGARFVTIGLTVWLSSLVVLTETARGETTAAGDVALPDYTPETTALGGTLTSKGSDTLAEVMAAWMDAFRTRHPSVNMALETRGSNTAPEALSSDTTLLAPMSRPMTKGERAGFKDTFGYNPTPVTVALDAVAVYVHKDNPVQGLTLQQLDQVFSTTHKCGGKPVRQWERLAVRARSLGPIRLHGRNDLSGTHDFFADRVLCGGAFRQAVTEHETSRDVIDAVAADPSAIGYAGLGYDTDAVKALSIGEGRDPESLRYFPVYVENLREDDEPSERFAYILDGRYPLSRPLYIYINKAPNEALEPIVREFLSFVLSAQGQEIVSAAGFVPMPGDQVSGERRKLDADYRPRRWWSFN